MSHTEWEYKSVEYTQKPLSWFEAMLKSMGSRGWELCCHDYGRAFFKRPKATSTSEAKS